jgi:cob(I)alamin adenosyltransferase
MGSTIRCRRCASSSCRRGGPATAACHLARTITRRAERRVWTLAAVSGDVNPDASRYLNRLSDLLFVIARVLARHENGAEITWNRERLKP